MLAHALLSALTADAPIPDTDTDLPATAPDRSDTTSLIPLTRNEIRRLFTALTHRIKTTDFILAWSHWRRRHQATARDCHYRRRAELTQ